MDIRGMKKHEVRKIMRSFLYFSPRVIWPRRIRWTCSRYRRHETCVQNLRQNIRTVATTEDKTKADERIMLQCNVCQRGGVDVT